MVAKAANRQEATTDSGEASYGASCFRATAEAVVEVPGAAQVAHGVAAPADSVASAAVTSAAVAEAQNGKNKHYGSSNFNK